MASGWGPTAAPPVAPAPVATLSHSMEPEAPAVSPPDIAPPNTSPAPRRVDKRKRIKPQMRASTPPATNVSSSRETVATVEGLPNGFTLQFKLRNGSLKPYSFFTGTCTCGQQRRIDRRAVMEKYLMDHAPHNSELQGLTVESFNWKHPIPQELRDMQRTLHTELPKPKLELLGPLWNRAYKGEWTLLSSKSTWHQAALAAVQAHRKQKRAKPAETQSPPSASGTSPSPSVATPQTSPEQPQSPPDQQEDSPPPEADRTQVEVPMPSPGPAAASASATQIPDADAEPTVIPVWPGLLAEPAAANTTEGRSVVDLGQWTGLLNASG